MNNTEIIQSLILLATIWAIVYGPIKAVKITRIMDQERESKAKKLEIFRALMRTRQVQLATDHVYALNMIEVEFYEETNVINAYREYVRQLNSGLPHVDDQRRYFDERHDRFVDLLCAMGKSLNYAFDKHELSRFGYAPVGWINDEDRQRNIQSLLVEMLEGKRPIPIAPMQIGPGSPFPPSPTIERK